MQKITQKEMIKFFLDRQNKNIVFSSFWNCSKIKYHYLINNVKKDGILKENLKLEQRSHHINLNGSRLDINNNDYYIIDDALVVVNLQCDNIIIYCDYTENNSISLIDQIEEGLIRAISNKTKNFYADYKLENYIDDFLKDNNIQFSKLELFGKIDYKLNYEEE